MRRLQKPLSFVQKAVAIWRDPVRIGVAWRLADDRLGTGLHSRGASDPDMAGAVGGRRFARHGPAGRRHRELCGRRRQRGNFQPRLSGNEAVATVGRPVQTCHRSLSPGRSKVVCGGRHVLFRTRAAGLDRHGFDTRPIRGPQPALAVIRKTASTCRALALALLPSRFEDPRLIRGVNLRVPPKRFHDTWLSWLPEILLYPRC